MTMFYDDNDIEFDFGPTIRRIKDRKCFKDIFYQKFPGNPNLIYLTAKGLEEFKKIVDPEIYLYKSDHPGAVVYVPKNVKTLRYKDLYWQEELEEFFNEVKSYLVRKRSSYLIKDQVCEYFDMDEPFSLYIEKFDESFPIRLNMNIRKEWMKKT